MFELFIANRYLRAKRKQVMISVITVISVAGVAVGVMALVIAMAVTSGLRDTTQRAILSATAPVIVKERTQGPGIEGWDAIATKLQSVPGVKDVTPALYDNAAIVGPVRATFAQLKGVAVTQERFLPEMLRHLKEGSLADMPERDGMVGILIGAELAADIGAVVGKPVTVIFPTGNVTPFGVRSRDERLRVAGIYESTADVESAWVFMAVQDAQHFGGYGNVVNAIELNVDDVNRAPQIAKLVEGKIGPGLAVTTWLEENLPLLDLFKLQQRATGVIIGLILMVAALNILITLVMMVMEKHRDIAVLMSLGARASQIRKIFIYKGAIIGAIGTVIGLVLGYSLSYLANRYQWVHLDTQMFSVKYLPLESRWTDAIWITVVSMGVSLLATIYPAWSATKVLPVESMRYE